MVSQVKYLLVILLIAIAVLNGFSIINGDSNDLYIINEAGEIGLGNKYLEIRFRDGDFSIIRLINKITMFDYELDQNVQPLLEIVGFIEHEDVGKRYVAYHPIDFNTRLIYFTESSQSVSMNIVLSGLNDWPIGYINLTIFIKIWLNSSSPEVCFNLELEDYSEEFYPLFVKFPILGGFRYFGFNPEYDRFVKEELHLYKPYEVFSNKSADFREIGIPWASPPGPGAIGIPFFAFYNSNDGTGLYYLIKDDNGTYKEIIVNMPNDTFVFQTINYIPLIKVQIYKIPYTVSLGVYRGYDWYDAAEVYRKYVEKKWWASRKLIDRIGEFPELHLIIRSMSYSNNSMSNPNDKSLTKVVSYDEFSSSAEIISRLFPGTNKAVGWVGWEKCGAVICWPDLFPPVEGEANLSKAIKTFHNYNIKVLPFSGTASYISANTSAHIDLLEAAVYGENGEILGFGWSPYNWNYFMDIRHPKWQQFLLQLSGKIHASGFDMVSFDGTPYLHINYMSTPYYNPGDPRGFVDSFIKLLEKIRDNTSLPISMEGRTEYLIPYYDLTPAVSIFPLSFIAQEFGYNAELIPFFQYIYHEYIQFGGDILEIGPVYNAHGYYGSPDHYYFRYELARSAVKFGAIVTVGDFWEGITYDDLIRLPDWEIDFIHRLALARATYARDFLVFGKMIKPPKIISEIPRVRMVGTVAQEDVYPYTGFPHLPNYTMPAIVSGGWMAPDSSVGYIFVNIADYEIPVEVEIPRFFNNETVYLVVDGYQKLLYSGLEPQTTIRFDLPPASISLLVIAEASSERAYGARLLGDNIVDLYSVLSRIRTLGYNFSDLYPTAEYMKSLYLQKEWMKLVDVTRNVRAELLERLEVIAYYRRNITDINLTELNIVFDLLSPRVLIDQVYSYMTLDPDLSRERSIGDPLWFYMGRIRDILVANGYNVSILYNGSLGELELGNFDLIVMANPHNKSLSISEADSLLTYVKEGGSLFLQISCESIRMSTGIRYFLEALGIRVYDEYLLYNGSYGIDVKIVGKGLFNNIKKFHVDSAPRVEIFGNATVIGWSPEDTYSQSGVQGPFPIVVSLKIGKGRIFVIFAYQAIQGYDYSNQPLIHAALKWLLNLKLSEQIPPGEVTKTITETLTTTETTTVTTYKTTTITKNFPTTITATITVTETIGHKETITQTKTITQTIEKPETTAFTETITESTTEINPTTITKEVPTIDWTETILIAIIALIIGFTIAWFAKRRQKTSIF